MKECKLKLMLSEGNRVKWFIFLLFSCTIFVKCILFHWFCYQTIVVSSIWRAPLDAFVFYFPKILVSILFGAFVFISKRYWWTIVSLAVMDIWCIANLMYFNANNLLLDVPAILMANNLTGFESSISAFWRLKYLWLVCFTITYAILLIVIGCKSKKRSFKEFFVCLSFVIVGNIGLCIPGWLRYYSDKADADFDMANGRQIIIQLYGTNGWRCFLPFHEVKMNALPDLTYNPDYASHYVYQNSIMHYAAAMCVYYVNAQSHVLPQVDIGELHGCSEAQNQSQLIVPKQNLIIILVESLESWPFEMGRFSWEVAPNFMDVRNSQNVVSFSTVRSEVKHGVSGDGQMIISSGLMPINAGAACILYSQNIWPSYISLYPHSIFVDCSNGIWHQRAMSEKYGYKTESYSDKNRTDEEVFVQLNNILDTIQTPYMTMALTSAMHSPFDRHPGYSLTVPNDMPQYMVEYLECLHYTDSCFGIFWRQYKQSQDSNTILLITGDHTVFKPAMLRDFHSYAEKRSFNISATESFCPLIICAPNITENILSTDTCYQMDIYPTIMHLIGCEDYYWKGFGVNLLDSAARKNRTISEKEAYELSDKLIRSNYFANYPEK